MKKFLTICLVFAFGLGTTLDVFAKADPSETPSESASCSSKRYNGEPEDNDLPYDCDAWGLPDGISYEIGPHKRHPTGDPVVYFYNSGHNTVEMTYWYYESRKDNWTGPITRRIRPGKTDWGPAGENGYVSHFCYKIL